MIHKSLAAGGLLAATLAMPALAADTAPYLDPAQPTEARVADLVGRFEVTEKIDLLSSTAPAVERLGIPEYDYWNESLHGVARAGRATVFPQAIGMAATFDPELLERVASPSGPRTSTSSVTPVGGAGRRRTARIPFSCP
jgi:beta-glucosidase